MIGLSAPNAEDSHRECAAAPLRHSGSIEGSGAFTAAAPNVYPRRL